MRISDHLNDFLVLWLTIASWYISLHTDISVLCIGIVLTVVNLNIFNSKTFNNTAKLHNIYVHFYIKAYKHNIFNILDKFF